jgi:hypothetical protein
MNQRISRDEDKVIPTQVRPIVEAVHRHYLSLPTGERPPLDDPRAIVGLLASVLKFEQLTLLASCSFYPLPPEVIRFGCTLKEYQRKQTVKLIRAEMADQLPEALKVLLETRT